MRMFATTLAAALALASAAPLLAQASAAIASGKAQPSALAPGEIVAAAPASDWRAIPVSDLLVMTLAPDRDGKARQVVIQLMPAPFSQGWIGNIRKLAAAHWWDGTSVNRVQDNYVVQWGDADAEDKAKAKALPGGLAKVPESEYTTGFVPGIIARRWDGKWAYPAIYVRQGHLPVPNPEAPNVADPYAAIYGYASGLPVALTTKSAESATTITVSPDRLWPVHCYGMVGVGRDLPPDTGTGAELYTVIGHAPRHLDRNIALVGRVVEGMEHLSSLPRGHLPLGFYDVEKGEKRVPIISIRLASELPAADQPRFEYLSTESDSFSRYADSVANRRDPFFIQPAGGADICNIRVPVRRVVQKR